MDACGYIQTGPRKEVADLDSLPFCDYDAFEFRRYLAQDIDLRVDFMYPIIRPELTMITSRSCVHQCTFCFRSEGRKYRSRSLDNVFAELESLLGKYQVEAVSFADEMIGLSTPKLREFCQRMKAYGLPWSTYFRVTDIDAERAGMLKDGGCRFVFLGLESASDEILKSMKKGITVAKIENALSILLEIRLKCQGYFLFCDPAETPDTLRRTLQWAMEHPQYNIFFSPLQYYPGSQIYWDAVERGQIKDRAAYLKNNSMTLNGTGFSDEEYADIINRMLPEYEKKRSLLRPEMKDQVLSLDQGRISLRGFCSHCGNAMAFERIFPLVSFGTFLCENCAALHISHLPYQEGFLRVNLSYLLEKYGRIAFWGIGYFFRQTITGDMITSPDIFLIDRQGGTFGEKEINGPELISREKISLVITPVSRGAAGSVESVKQQAAGLGVTKFIDSGDLLCRDLRLDKA